MYNLLSVVLSDTLQRLLLKNYSYGWHRFYQSNILAQYLYFFLIFGTFDSTAHTHHSCTPELNLCKIVSQNWFECFDYFFISRKTSFMLVISSKWFKKKKHITYASYSHVDNVIRCPSLKVSFSVLLFVVLAALSEEMTSDNPKTSLCYF